jgi:predicted RNA-binding Zn-ribbon protein involved in translation (DUF1610 family)
MERGRDQGPEPHGALRAVLRRVCGVFIATRDNNLRFKTVMGNLYGTRPRTPSASGACAGPPKKLYGYCASCTIRDCVRGKGLYSCHQCPDWPCAQIRDFGLATGRRVMQQTIPVWREKVKELGDTQGSVEWARSVCERYHCPDCGNPLFRGAQRCRACGKAVADDLDGSL